MEKCQVSQREIERKLILLGEHGRTKEGGISRFAFTKEDKGARELVMQWMQELGMAVKVDAAGNIIGRLGDSNQPAVAMGSHLDTVPNGGLYDGPLGVVSALEVVRLLKENEVELISPVEVIVFADEEGSRFGGGLFGSQAMTGQLSSEILERKDEQGVTIAEAMQAFGLNPEALQDAVRTTDDFKAYIEVHVEQATVLEEEDYGVGIVKGIAGPVHFRAQLLGRADHAGATPMNLRKDALLGAAEAALAAEDIANRAGDSTVATVGQLFVEPGGVNVIPGKARLSFDVRDLNETDREWAVMEIKQSLQRIADERGLALSIEDLSSVPPVELAANLVALCEGLAAEHNIPALTMVSGAAHDAMNMTHLTEVVMLFVRSKNGVSHCPEEWSDPEDIVEACSLLYYLVEQLVK